MEINKIIDKDITDERDTKKLWYAITTFSTHEHKVLDDLITKLIINKQHGDIVDACFLAEKEEIITVTDKKTGKSKTKTIVKNMTPGYIYIKMQMTDDAWYTIRNTPSVSGFVGSHGKRAKPVPISDNEMIPVLKYCNKMDLLGKMEAPYKKGDMVKVINGPFAGQHGKVESLSKNNTLVNIDLILLGQTIKVEISIDDIINYDK